MDMAKLSDYCTISREGTAWIDIDSGWKFPCILHGMNPDYALIFIRRLSKKRRLYDEAELLEAEVVVPDMLRQEQIVGAVKTAFEMWLTMAQLGGEYDEIHQQTGDDFYGSAQKYASTMFGELNDYYYMLIDQLMGV